MEEDLEEGMVEDLGSNDCCCKDNICLGLEDYSSIMGFFYYSSSSIMGCFFSNNSSMISIKRVMIMVMMIMGMEMVIIRVMMVNIMIIMDEEDFYWIKVICSKIIMI